MSSSLLKRGITLWQSGQKNEARKIFETIVHNDWQNEAAWIWLIYTRATNPEKITALDQYLVIFPQNETARKALASLQEEEQAAARQVQAETQEEKKEGTSPAGLVPAPEKRPVKKGYLPYLPSMLVAFGACIFLLSSFVFIAQYNSLQDQYKKLEADRQQVLQNLARRNSEYQTLQAEKDNLSSQYNSLTGQYESLNGEYSALQGRYTDLNNDYSVLSKKYDSLSAEHVSLQSYVTDLQAHYKDTVNEIASYKQTAIAPPYIYIHGRMVYLSFLTPSQEIYDWKVPFDQLESDLNRGNEERNKIRLDQTYERMILNNKITGENYRIIDYAEFVDPRVFTTFSSYFYSRAPIEETFITEIWYIVAQLTKYSGEITDTPRYPLETLLAGGGDCEDNAILFASMILAAAPPDWEVYLLYMDLDHPYEPQTINHVIVY
ncbi:MAG: hypothetical protein ACM3XO_07980, partial [Bacteroidota bacterium]